MNKIKTRNYLQNYNIFDKSVIKVLTAILRSKRKKRFLNPQIKLQKSNLICLLNGCYGQHTVLRTWEVERWI